jgi:hypothetical protein
MPKLGSGPIEQAYIDKMNVLALVLDEMFNEDLDHKEIGFILMVFPFEDRPGRCNYISNADRKDVVTLLKEQLAYFEGQSDTLKGTA